MSSPWLKLQQVQNYRARHIPRTWSCILLIYSLIYIFTACYVFITVFLFQHLQSRITTAVILSFVLPQLQGVIKLILGNGELSMTNFIKPKRSQRERERALKYTKLTRCIQLCPSPQLELYCEHGNLPTHLFGQRHPLLWMLQIIINVPVQERLEIKVTV